MEMIGHNDIIQTTKVLETMLALLIQSFYYLSCGTQTHYTIYYLTKSGDMVMRTYRHEIQTTHGIVIIL